MNKTIFKCFKYLYVLAVALPLSMFILIFTYSLYAILDVYRIITKTIKNAKTKFVAIAFKRVR